MSAGSKRCNHCKKTKPYSDFNKRAAIKDGHHGTCRDCAKAEKAAYRAANPQAESESYKKWRSENAGRLAEINSAANKARHAESKSTADKMHAKWTDDELATVMRDDLTLMEMCKLLGRTYGSVSVKRNMMRDRQKRLEIIAGVQRRLAS